MNKSLQFLPYELMVSVVKYLRHSDLLVLRQTCHQYALLANEFLFKVLDIDDRHSYNPELVAKYGGLVRRLGVFGLDAASVNYARLINSCSSLHDIFINRASLDEPLIKAIVARYPRLRALKVCLNAHRQLSGNLGTWSHLTSLKTLQTLHLNYVDHRVAENLFYSLPYLRDFRVKLVSEESSEYNFPKSFKENFYNPRLTRLHVESWVKGVEIDKDLFVVKPGNFPRLISLGLVSYQTCTQTWFHYAWPQLRHARVDFVRCDEDADALVSNCSYLNSFHCMMWSASGKALDQLIVGLNNLVTLNIESSLTQATFKELSPAPRIYDLQIGVVKFSAETLALMATIFPGATTVQLGHCKPDPAIVESIRSLSLSLSWTSLSVFQLNPVVAAICSMAPKLTQITYDLPSKQCDGVKFRKLAQASPISSLKVMKKSEPALCL